jgi:hypothetical protein
MVSVYFGGWLSVFTIIIIIIIIINIIIVVVVTIIADRGGRLLTQLRRKLGSPATQTLCTC